MTHVLGLYTGVVFEREEKKWLPLARAFLSIQLVKVQNKHELVYRVWAYQGKLGGHFRLCFLVDTSLDLSNVSILIVNCFKNSDIHLQTKS